MKNFTSYNKIQAAVMEPVADAQGKSICKQ